MSIDFVVNKKCNIVATLLLNCLSRYAYEPANANEAVSMQMSPLYYFIVYHGNQAGGLTLTSQGQRAKVTPCRVRAAPVVLPW